MDSKDFHLLVALYENARQSYRALARVVSLSAPVVRDRLRNLESRGVLQGYMLSIDPSVFERDDLILTFRGEFTRQDAVKALAAPDVAWVSWKLDGGLTVGVWSRDRAQTIEGLAAVLGVKPSRQFLTERRWHRPLSMIDLSIIDALIDQPRMSLNELIGSTGLSPKTVRKHLQLLVKGETIFIEPRLGALADSGELVYQLAIAGGVRLSELRSILGDAFLVNEMKEPPTKSLLCRGSNLGEVTNKTRAVEKLAGVESVTLTLNREMLVATKFAHLLVRGQINDSEQAWQRKSVKRSHRSNSLTLA